MHSSSHRGPRPAGALVAVLAVATACARPAADAGPQAGLPALAPSAGYVTSQACRTCHPSQYASWHASYHRGMTQAASPDAVSGDFDDVELAVAGERYRLRREKDEFWVELDRGPGTAEERRPIVMTTGSHHRQWVWFPAGEGRGLATLPFIFLRDERRWVPRYAAFMLPPDPRWVPSRHEGLWGSNCVACHTTDPERAGPTNPGGRVAELGIACEACHGPAAEHVAANHDPARRYRLHLGGESDATVVHPARLPADRLSQVCGQCHALRAAQGLLRPGGDPSAAFSGKEWGNPLPEASQWPDGQIHTGGREYDALLDTPCHRRGAMSCLSCHSMHRADDDPRPLPAWADDQLAPGMETDEACLQCHRSDGAAAPCYDCERHTGHPTASSGSRCYDCHMPHTSYALLKAIRNHQVVADSVATSVATGRPHACNLCHLDKSLGWTAEYLEKWYGLPPPALTDDQRQVAAAVLWAASGHAGQRALVAWHLGWRPAAEASGRIWTVPYLTLLMNDPYPAVRLIAFRALRELPEFEGFPFDYVGPPEEREAALRRAVGIWRAELVRRTETGDALLIAPDGSLRQEELARLVATRDDRPVFWVE